MQNINGSEDWRVLCELAAKEKDPEKLFDLIAKINQALEESRRQPRHQEESSPAGFVAQF